MSLLLISLLIGGCSSDVLAEPSTTNSIQVSPTVPEPTTTSAQPTSSTFTDESRAAEARLIADSFVSLGAAHSNWLVVDDAITTLINQCLRDNGLTFQQMLPSTKGTSNADLEFDVIGMLLVDANTYGLTDYLRLQQQRTDPETSEPPIPAGEEELIASALWGDESAPRVRIEEDNGIVHHFPTTGCQAEAQEEVYEVTVAEYERTRLGLPSISGVIDRVMSDANLRAAEAVWATCMNGNGHGEVQSLDDLFSTVFDAFGEYAAQGDGVDRLDAWESELAAADSACREEAGFRNAVLDAFIAHGKQTLEEHEDVLAVARQIEETALQNAERITSDDQL